MGMKARVIGVGPFKKELAEHMDYPDYHDETDENVTVVSTFFRCSTADSSRELAYALGVQPWDFNTHHVKSVDQVAWEVLRGLGESQAWEEKDYVGFEKCLKAGWIFVYEPNG